MPKKVREIYKLTKAEVKHGWPSMTPQARQAVVNRNLKIINDPESDERAIGIATKNLIMINAQNIGLDEDAPKQDNNVVIKIVEDNPEAYQG